MEVAFSRFVVVATLKQRDQVHWDEGVEDVWRSGAPGRQPYFLPGRQQVLVHVGAQEACIAVAFHQFIDVVLEEER